MTGVGNSWYAILGSYKKAAKKLKFVWKCRFTNQILRTLPPRIVTTKAARACVFEEKNCILLTKYEREDN